ncbi:MAG TPA: DNA-formamidopyrimidine glycosylase family protein [Candidatus Acidoferrum sp.]|nr:DNA-formamidopyrimidine glycosylase family protein [Candidatus Acidoferrum sp.]
MPELPDITVYIEALERRIEGRPVERIALRSPFILRTVEPPIAAAEGRTVAGLRRLGKRIVLDLGDGLFLAIHLMIAGRLRWLARGAKGPGRITLATFDFANGTLALTEAGTMRRAAIHLVQGEAALRALDRGGIDVLAATAEAFSARLRSESHTLKRALTDPRLFSGIGNAYSDEILHAARLSPLTLTGRLDDAEVARLYAACRDTLMAWTGRLREETGEGFPEKVTAFREGMAMHGRFGLPCPVCRSPVQRIRYAENETNYCARCQTGGRLLADRALSRLLRQDWPRSLDEID